MLRERKSKREGRYGVNTCSLIKQQRSQLIHLICQLEEKHGRDLFTWEGVGGMMTRRKLHEKKDRRKGKGGFYCSKELKQMMKTEVKRKNVIEVNDVGKIRRGEDEAQFCVWPKRGLKQECKWKDKKERKHSHCPLHCSRQFHHPANESQRCTNITFWSFTLSSMTLITFMLHKMLNPFI